MLAARPDTNDMMYFLAFVYGLIFGSFLNVLIDRLPKGQDVIWGRSRCDYCKRNLRWFELIPVISFVLQGGKCLRCYKKLSIQYMLMEVVTAIGFTVLLLFFHYSLGLYLASLVIFSSLLVITVTDFKTQIIPDSMIVLGLLGAIAFFTVQNALSAVAATGFFYALWYFTKGRGMGFGDVKLAFLLGLILGYPKIVAALYIAFLTGAVVGVILIFRGKKSLKSKIAFGPFMILGAVGSLLFHNFIQILWKTYF
jgi:leader peptidase (prepilin peptidase)/N-methyltransferase